jgi:hypothetical protein
MANDRLTAISAKQLTAEVPKAVDAALKKHARFAGAKLERGFCYIPPWIVGFVIRGEGLDKGTLAESTALAADVAKTLKGGSPTVWIRDRHIICGYMPEPGFPIFAEQ